VTWTEQQINELELCRDAVSVHTPFLVAGGGGVAMLPDDVAATITLTRVGTAGLPVCCPIYKEVGRDLE